MYAIAERAIVEAKQNLDGKSDAGLCLEDFATAMKVLRQFVLATDDVGSSKDKPPVQPTPALRMSRKRFVRSSMLLCVS